MSAHAKIAETLRQMADQADQYGTSIDSHDLRVIALQVQEQGEMVRLGLLDQAEVPA